MGRLVMIPKSKAINDWIFLPNALPSQYWDLAGPVMAVMPWMSSLVLVFFYFGLG
jgi:hypothetical protein